MHKPEWCIFYDFHTMPACPHVGENFDFDRWTDLIKECGVDFIVFAARCNLGMSYYDTKLGIRHPALHYDLIGKLSEQCRKKGIALSCYMNGGLSHEEGLLHRDWLAVTPDGKIYDNPEGNENFFRQMCVNSPYGDHAVAMIDEITKNYDIQGIFIDCLAPRPCVGVECVREMKKQGIDWRDPLAVKRFSRDSIKRFCRRIADTAKANRPDLLVYFNGVLHESQLDSGNYYEIECLPTGGWGYDTLPLMARYHRNFGCDVVNMTGRFHRSWGDFGGIRTEASLEYDVAYGLANCLAPSVGDHFHPRGDINEPVFALIKKVYKKYQRYREWLDGARQVSDIAVVVSSSDFVDCPDTYLAATGIMSRLCGELKLQASLYTDALDVPPVKLMIAPDCVGLDGAAGEKIRKHLASGGKLIVSYKTGLKDGAFPPEWGVKYHGNGKTEVSYFRVIDGKMAAGVPDMPVTIYHKGLSVTAADSAEMLAELVSPLVDSGWNGEHNNAYNPPDAPTGEAVLVRNGNVRYFSFPVFKSYCQYAQIPLRTLLSNVISEVLPEPVLRTEGLPSFGRAFVTEQPEKNRRMVHLLAFVAEPRGKMLQIEEGIDVLRAKLALRLDGRRIAHVYTAPDGKELAFRCEDGYCRIDVPAFTGYLMTVFEFQPEFL